MDRPKVADVTADGRRYVLGDTHYNTPELRQGMCVAQPGTGRHAAWTVSPSGWGRRSAGSFMLRLLAIEPFNGFVQKHL